MNYRTEQEIFWSGKFGDEYIDRNQEESIISSNIALFSDILRSTSAVSSVIEFGANIGLNLAAIRSLLPSVELSAVEINKKAASILERMGDVTVYQKSILDFQPEGEKDFVLIKGVLIHINPDELRNVYERLYRCSQKYICIVEYYNPSPVEVEYRGHKGRLFKRDFAGEMMDQFSDLRLVNYGFVYHRDNVFPQDDTTWFLLGKSGLC